MPIIKPNFSPWRFISLLNPYKWSINVQALGSSIPTQQALCPWSLAFHHCDSDRWQPHGLEKWCFPIWRYCMHCVAHLSMASWLLIAHKCSWICVTLMNLLTCIQAINYSFVSNYADDFCILYSSSLCKLTMLTVPVLI